MNMRLSKSSVTKLTNLIPAVLAGYAVIHILFMMFLWMNHVAFPLNLEAMELTILEHLKRVMIGLPLYPEPTGDFVALAYNPLYYFLCVPFAWIFGTNLFTMRLVAILGMLGSGIIIFLALRRATGSNWWGLMGSGLFAAAYQVMDTYLDNAHSDSWLLFTVLLGCYLIEQNHSPRRNLLGVFLMVSAFWFKQHGALFAIGTLIYLTLRDGWQKSWHYWVVTLFLGPGLYWGAPDWLFGPRFHYFTWEVPRRWSDFGFGAIQRLVGFIARSYFFLAIIGAIASVSALLSEAKLLATPAENPKGRESHPTVNIWYFMLPIALLTGLMGALDDSNNNVFIPMGVLFIITGLLGIKKLTDRYMVMEQWNLHFCALAGSFLLFLYNPIPVIVPPQATTAYQDLIGFLKSLNGSVYAPWIGQLQDGYQFYPVAHGVPLSDIIRGPRINVRNNPTIKKLLTSVSNPNGKAYLLLTNPLKVDYLLDFLQEKYVLDQDLAKRFATLTTLPKRYNLLWPRYLYRYAPEEAAKQALNETSTPAKK